MNRTQIEYTIPFEIKSGIYSEKIISMLLANSNGIYHSFYLLLLDCVKLCGAIISGKFEYFLLILDLLVNIKSILNEISSPDYVNLVLLLRI